ncbi:RNA polymerase sigma-70 factor [Spirosoma validum]|uniref:RNA polymerase sigma-70 factor n=1 Tax=Spirosoma validum TaxID=2771355 RepID=A0A927AWV1_9BACT|nr:RNA polymerase sigma-70 factor [Spirosoma validum]MBD2751261.1 RNA polymerase sigma-70 factor [Spirosoma validum]
MNQLLPLLTEMGHIQPLNVSPNRTNPAFWREEDTTKNPVERPQLDTELFIRKTFEQDVDAGISLLFRQYYTLLCSHAVRYVSSKAVAEDIVSDIFYEFHSELRFQTITSSYRAYLFTAVRNRAFDYIRAEMRQSTSLDHAEFVPAHSTQSPDSITQYEELYHDVEDAINAMPLKRRQIYVMHRFEGKKYQEIADELNLSLRTVESHLYQAIHQIRNALKNKWQFLICLFAALWS